MAKKIPLKSIIKSIGTYQIVLLTSRGLGFLRDFLILLVLGASAYSDDVFFLIGFTDLVTTVLAGGGAALFLSIQMKEAPIESYYSGLVFYIFIAVLLVAFELVSSSTIGSYLYEPLSSVESTNQAYQITVFGMIFAFPLVCSYAVFLNKNKLYLQPLLNIIFTLFVIAVLTYFFFSNNFKVLLFAKIMLFGVLVRYVIAFTLSKKLVGLKIENFRLCTKRKFYFEMLLSGLSVGLLISIPFIFRGGLPEYGDGIYSTSAFVFKLNDMVLALLFIPLVSILLSQYEISLKLVVTLLFLSIMVPLCMILAYCFGMFFLPEIELYLKEQAFSVEVIRFSLYAFVFTCSAYLLGMIQVKLGQQKSLFFLSFLLLIGVKENVFYGGTSELPFYFYNFYWCYSIFVTCMIVAIVFFYRRDKRIAN